MRNLHRTPLRSLPVKRKPQRKPWIRYQTETITGVVFALILTPLAMVFAVASMGGGHGDYIWAKNLFPWPMILAGFIKRINIVCVIMGFLQLPFYAAFIFQFPGKPALNFLIVVLAHAAAVYWARQLEF